MNTRELVCVCGHGTSQEKVVGSGCRSDRSRPRREIVSGKISSESEQRNGRESDRTRHTEVREERKLVSEKESGRGDSFREKTPVCYRFC